MKRLPNNFGSVTKLSGSRRRPYAARVLVQNPMEGYKRKHMYIGYYATRQEAIQALADLKSQDVCITGFFATVNDMWNIFQERRFPAISESGRRVYNAAFNHLAPIADKPIREIKAYELQKLIDGINRQWITKSHVLSLINQLFEIAMEMDICQKNYAAFVKLPPKTKSNIHKAFTDDELQLLFSAGDHTAKAILIMCYTGMRPNELLTMRNENVHIEERYMIGGSKTDAGKNRIIPIADKILPFVQEFYSDKELLYPVSYRAFKAHFDKLLLLHGIEHHLPHDGRHTFATLADRAGVNPTAVKIIMGHKTADITKEVYTHKDIKDLLQAVNAL